MLLKQVLVLMGQSGGGKSLFLVQLTRRLNDLFKKNKLHCTIKGTIWRTLDFKFRDYADDPASLKRFLTAHLKDLDEVEKIIIFADGFDEFNRVDC